MMRDRRCPFLLCLLAVLALLAAPAAAQADDAAQAERFTLADDPFEITDALAAGPGEAELAIVGIYERARRGAYRSTFALDTEAQLGVARGLEIRLGQISAYGNLETRGSPDTSAATGANGAGPAWGGATRLGTLYQITDGRGPLPVASMLGRVRTVYGPGTPSYEGDVVALLGKTLGTGSRAVGINLDLGRTASLPGRASAPANTRSPPQ